MDTDTVLVVEDDRLARETLCEVLNDTGHKALGASDGQAAIDYLEKADQLPCLILLDLMMPGLNGWEFREWQRREPRFANIPVIALSAVADLPSQAKKLGLTAFLTKPLRLDSLIAEVEEHC